MHRSFYEAGERFITRERVEKRDKGKTWGKLEADSRACPGWPKAAWSPVCPMRAASQTPSVMSTSGNSFEHSLLGHQSGVSKEFISAVDSSSGIILGLLQEREKVHQEYQT
jgi:hypothetical protein